MVTSEANVHQPGDQEHMTTIKCRVAGFLVGSYLIVTMSIWIPQTIWIWSWLVTLKNILKLRKYPPFSWNIFSIEMEQHGYVIYSRTRPHVFWQSFHRAASHPSHFILNIEARFLFFCFPGSWQVLESVPHVVRWCFCIFKHCFVEVFFCILYTCTLYIFVYTIFSFIIDITIT